MTLITKCATQSPIIIHQIGAICTQKLSAAHGMLTDGTRNGAIGTMMAVGNIVTLLKE